MRAFFYCLALLLTLPTGFVRADELPACGGAVPDTTLTVSHVLDGETLRLHNGRDLRLDGILAPRAQDVGAATSDKWPTAVAARAELEALALGREVAILGGARDDRYGRHVGHAAIRSAGAGSGWIWLQGHLVRQGLARVMTSAPNRMCAGELLAIEREARSAGRGLWAEAAYQVRRAGGRDTLVALRGTFQIVEGDIAKAEGGRMLRIEFAGVRGVSLRAVVALPRDRGPATQSTPKRGQESALTGTRVRVRGFLEERGGVPLLDLSIIGDIEVLSEGGQTDTRP